MKVNLSAHVSVVMSLSKALLGVYFILICFSCLVLGVQAVKRVRNANAAIPCDLSVQLPGFTPLVGNK